MKRKSASRTDEAGRLADEALLARRLTALGLSGVDRVAVHQNRTVMVSVSQQTLRLHRGYAYASDRVLGAIVKFLRARTRRERLDAERQLLIFPVEHYAAAPRRRRKIRRDEHSLLSEARRRHALLNERFFGGTLSAIRFRLSRRMRTQLGALVLDERHGAVEIALNRQHIERDGWVEAAKTLLHEMVHQWQAESGIDVDHGPGFRRKALEVGIEPTARRDLESTPAAVEASLFPEE